MFLVKLEQITYTIPYVKVRNRIILILERKSARVVTIEKPVYSWKYIFCVGYMNDGIEWVLINTPN